MVGRVDHATAGWIFAHLGKGYGRLGKLEKALDELKLALQRLREPTPLRARVLSDRGWVLASLGRYQEAASSCIEAARIPGGDAIVNLANLAEALDRLGDREAALQVFREALATADLSKPRDCFATASGAAELGLDAEAVELFARFVAHKSGVALGGRSAIEVIRAASDDDKGALMDMPALHAAVRRATAMVDELARLGARGPGVEPPDAGASAEALDVFEATRRLREAAAAQVLPPDGDDQA
jgi:tetratricopeptide (TPR) repeat protein